MEKNKKPKVENSKRVKEMTGLQSSKADPNGSYTGVPQNPYDKPVQDSDDI